MSLTIDTSAVLAVMLREPSRDRVVAETEEMALLAAPTLPWEVGNALSALFRRKRLDSRAAAEVLSVLERIPIRLADVDLRESVVMAEQHGIDAYDAYVLECARRYRTPLLSLDAAQCAVARAMGIDVIEVRP